MNKIRILSSGLAKTNHRISNHDLEKIVDTSHEWIVQRTGISSRYVSFDENTSDLACAAARQAIENANIDKTTIDAIIVATMTPDNITPSTACLVQQKLGLNNCQMLSFDINGACSGFIYALQVASDLLNRYQRILVIGSETLSKMIDYQDRSTCVLFGDGAGAMIIEKGQSALYHYANSIGNEEALCAKGLPLLNKLENREDISHYLTMQGNDVFRFAVMALKEAIESVLEQSSYTMDDIDLIIPHQANYRIISHVAKKMNVDISKFFMNLQEYGNTSAASIPIAYHDALTQGYIQKESRIILVGFGAGLTYGATLIDKEENYVVE